MDHNDSIEDLIWWLDLKKYKLQSSSIPFFNSWEIIDFELHIGLIILRYVNFRQKKYSKSIKMIMKSLTLIVAVAATGEFWAMNPDCPDIDGKFGLIWVNSFEARRWKLTYDLTSGILISVLRMRQRLPRRKPELPYCMWGWF